MRSLRLVLLLGICAVGLGIDAASTNDSLGLLRSEFAPGRKPSSVATDPLPYGEDARKILASSRDADASSTKVNRPTVHGLEIPTGSDLKKLLRNELPAGSRDLHGILKSSGNGPLPLTEPVLLGTQAPCPNIVIENGEKRYIGPVNIPDPSKAGVAGDDIATAIPIPLPFSPFLGTTTGFSDDYEEICPYNAPGSPDVVYSYSPPFDQQVVIWLCGSYYDTKVYIYEDAATPGAPYACNDDACGSDGYRSYLDCLPVYAGHTYYIVVDGFGGASGDFVFSMDSCSTDCIWTGCSSGAVPEGEACEYVFSDSVNGGCFSAAQMMTPLVSGQPVCGTSWVHSTAGYTVDYDWYSIDVEAGDLIDTYIRSSFAVSINIYSMTSGCATLVGQGSGSQFPCRMMGFENYSLTSPGKWVVEVMTGPSSQLMRCLDGPHEYELQVNVRKPPCEWTCNPASAAEGEECVESTTDNFNGGCNSIPEIYSPIVPDVPVCGEVWKDPSLGYRDTDWYRTPYFLLEGDSVTWCVTGNFLYNSFILDVRNGCTVLQVLASGEGDPCDTTYIGARIDSTGYYAFFVAPSFSAPDLVCEDGPWVYEGLLTRETPCVWPGCPPGATPEGELCEELPFDTYNGGCNSIPPIYSSIAYGEGVCGTTFFSGGTRDTDWYLFTAAPGELMTWCVRAEFAPLVAIIEITDGCGALILHALAVGTSCDWITVEYLAPSGGEFVLFVAPDWSSPTLLCVDGPWEYVAYLNPGPTCAWPGCNPGGFAESEPCVEDADIVNGGCNSIPEKYISIEPGKKVCGQSYWNGSMRDTDWYLATLAEGDSVTWCVTANHPFVNAIIDLRSGCPIGFEDIIAVSSNAECDTSYVAVRIPGSGNFAFLVAAEFTSVPQFCEHGPWVYDAALDYAYPCACDCAHDPVCNGVTDILDITKVIDVAFRFDPDILDPNPGCPWTTTDVNCDNVTDILDITRTVNVAFRFQDPAVEFCDPCAFLGSD